MNLIKLAAFFSLFPRGDSFVVKTDNPIEIFKYGSSHDKHCMRTLNRRGMSPLIATVLLMAFAVALGGMIMNWQGGTKSLDCSEISVTVQQFCYDEATSKIRVEARNTGEEQVASLILRISSPDSGAFDITVPNSRLNKGQTAIAKVPFGVTVSTSVELLSNIEVTGVPELCPAPIASKQPLPKC